MTDQEGIALAIEQARAGMAAGQSPFGAAIARDGRVAAVSFNRVLAETDPTAHAEIRCIRAACAALGTIDLSGYTIYSTTEPCPMCFAACHWARLSRIVYGAEIDDARRAGFNELAISNAQLKALGGSEVQIVRGVLQQPCAALFDQWLARPGHRAY